MARRGGRKCFDLACLKMREQLLEGGEVWKSMPYDGGVEEKIGKFVT